MTSDGFGGRGSLCQWFLGITTGVGDTLALSMRCGASGWVSRNASPWRLGGKAKKGRAKSALFARLVYFLLLVMYVLACMEVYSPNAKLCVGVPLFSWAWACFVWCYGLRRGLRWSSQPILAVMRVRWCRSCRDLAASRRSGWGISAARYQ
ncbi:hypothetical protein B0T18DRAFT_188160 [Schizothecium vesticola]|uniref:Uncharacterized protein n=1 Tax=Schizothecium vesticola TaxID=314040 RepID=A0AA40K2Q5_9PEZI|nr:hypothetical protein B0T18DRAFT_188160 [Schizothecium vesticola]